MARNKESTTLLRLWSDQENALPLELELRAGRVPGMEEGTRPRVSFQELMVSFLKKVRVWGQRAQLPYLGYLGLAFGLGGEGGRHRASMENWLQGSSTDRSWKATACARASQSAFVWQL